MLHRKLLYRPAARGRHEEDDPGTVAMGGRVVVAFGTHGPANQLDHHLQGRRHAHAVDGGTRRPVGAFQHPLDADQHVVAFRENTISFPSYRLQEAVLVLQPRACRVQHPRPLPAKAVDEPLYQMVAAARHRWNPDNGFGPTVMFPLADDFSDQLFLDVGWQSCSGR